MSAAAQVPSGGRAHGMLSVVGLTDDQLERLCEEARLKNGEDTVCRVANYLFPQVCDNSNAAQVYAGSFQHCSCRFTAESNTVLRFGCHVIFQTSNMRLREEASLKNRQHTLQQPSTAIAVLQHVVALARLHCYYCLALIDLSCCTCTR